MYTEMNLHWRPYSTICDFCTMKYRVISKMETFQDDRSHILQMLGVADEQLRMNTHGGFKTTDLTKHYFKNISMKVKEKLLEIYKDDFGLFNYDTRIY